MSAVERAVERYRELLAEQPEAQLPTVREALAWSKLHAEVSEDVWERARLWHERPDAEPELPEVALAELNGTYYLPVPGVTSGSGTVYSVRADGDRLIYERLRGHSGHGRRKLTLEQVREIRQRAAAGESQMDLGRAFGLSGRAIGYLVNGQTYQDVL